MSTYQLCRWYDPYPRLAFALQLLKWAPAELRREIIRDFVYLMQTQGDCVLFLNEMPRTLPLFGLGKRGYDDSFEMARVLEALKQSSEAVKHLSANKLLRALDRTPVS